MSVSLVSLAERPDLIDAMWDLPQTWAPFMQNDPFGDLFFPQLPQVFPDYQLVALDEKGELVGKVHSVPFRWAGTYDDLPLRGWDAVLARAFTGHDRGHQPTAVSLIEAFVTPARQGTGLSRELLQGARGHVRRLGFSDLFGPVRPTRKSLEPETPMADYIARVRPDGLPVDPWLRVHARLGARLVKICPASMTVTETLARWREWTGLPFLTSGSVLVPDALVPVHASLEHDHAVYVEPNVWMHHRLAP